MGNESLTSNPLGGASIYGPRLHPSCNYDQQTYRQVKNSLGWAYYQVRKDVFIRRH
jgi:hypothetical protein